MEDRVIRHLARSTRGRILRGKANGGGYRKVAMRGTTVLLMLWAACAHDGSPPPEPWKQWARPGGGDEQRVTDYAECTSQAGGVGMIAARRENQFLYEACMVGRGWQLRQEPGDADRPLVPETETRE